MKLLAIITILILAGSLFNNVLPQDTMDVARPPTGAWSGGAKVSINVPITWTMHMTVGTGNVTGMTNGFQVFLSDFPGGYPQDLNGTFTKITMTLWYGCIMG